MGEISGWLVLLGVILAGFLIWSLAKRIPKQAPKEKSDGDEKKSSPEKAQPTPPPTKPKPSGSGKGWEIAKTVLKWAVILLALSLIAYLVYLFITWSVVQDAWKTARTFPTGITYRQPGGATQVPVGIQSTAPADRVPLGTECPKLSRDERETCMVHHASDWIEFETGPRVTNYEFEIQPNYDQDRLLPKNKQVVRELWFRLEDGTLFQYTGTPLPQMATDFRVVYNRPTELVYRMYRVYGTDSE